MVRRKSANSGFQTRRIKEKLNAPLPGPWMPIGREMLRSGAMRSLSIHARRCLDRIMIEGLIEVPALRNRLRCTECGGRPIDVRPDWSQHRAPGRG
jgi:hypothetical protein